MLEKLQKTYHFLKLLDSLDAHIIKELYEIFPPLNQLISIPKNNQTLVQEEIQSINRLLFRSYKKIYEISDLLEINYKNDNEEILNKIILKSEENISIEDQIVALFFDCIKRKEIFSENLRRIQKSLPKFRITSSHLLEYLIKESTLNLRIMLLHICSKFMTLPFLIKSNLEETEINQPDYVYNLIPEFIFLFEDSMTNVLSFCFSENKYIYPKGKSHILNFFFGRNFLTEEKLRAKTQIEFQFDYHYAQPMNLNIADYHGVADLDLIFKLVPFFNYYLLHLKSEQLSNFKEDISQLIKKIRESHKNFVLIVFIHQQGFAKIDVDSRENNVFFIKINEIRSMLDKELKNLMDEVWNKMNVSSSKNSSFYTLDCVKEKYLLICKNFASKENIELYEQKILKIKKFVDFLQKFENNFLDDQLLPFTQTFMSLSERQKYYDSNYTEWSENKRNEEVQELERLSNLHKSQKTLPIVQIFYDLLYDECFMGNLLDSSSRVKQIVDLGLSDLYKERNKLNEEISKNKDESKKSAYEEMKKKIIDTIKKKSFSYELIVRELYYIHRNEKIPIEDNTKRYFENVVTSLISCGQPFEVIDGDNLHFITDFFPKMFRNDNSSILVISVIGPQSAGKSTLLNFLFGTQFASSSGRCTKGMYGGLMNIKNHPKYQKILILDTEGILSSERNDHLFDKKLILFCLCVSHVTILCNKGDIHKGMKDVLKLTSECMKDLKEQKFVDPNIYVVLNALTDISDKLMVPLNDLEVKLTGVEMLPFAYEMKGIHSDVKVNVPSTSFSQKCWDFRMKILSQYKQQGDINNYTLSDWFSFSQSLWEKIGKFRNLINYINIEEQLQDNQLTKLIGNLVDEFKNIMGEDNLKLNKIVDDCCKDFDLANFKKISKDLDFEIEKRASQFKENYIEKFKKECMDRNISEELMKKRKILLEKNMNKEVENWKLIASKVLNEKKIQSSKAGDISVNDEIDRLVKENKNQPYSKEEALEKFDIFWKDKIIEPIIKSIKTLEERKEDCFQTVKKNYDSCTTNLLFDHQIESNLKEFFSVKSQEVILKVFKKNDFLFFKEGTLPEINELVKLNNQKGKFVELKENLFFKNLMYDVVEINIKEGFNQNRLYYDLYFEIERNCKPVRSWNLYSYVRKWYIQEKSKKASLMKYFNSLKEECKKLFIIFDYDKDFVSQLIKKIEESVELDDNQYKNLKDLIWKITTMISESFTIEKITKIKESHGFYSYFFTQKLYKYHTLNPDQYESKMKSDINYILTSENITYYVNPELEEDFKKMFNWYIDPSNVSNLMTPLKVKTCISYFQNLFNWKKILERIFLFVYKSIYKETNIENVNFVEEIEKINKAIKENKDINEDIQKYSDLSTSVIYSLIKETEYLIDDINKEIKQFRVQISQQATGIFHETALMLFWNLYTILEHYKAYEPIRINNKNKECLQNFFTSVLTKDTAKIDKDTATLIFQKTMESLYAHILKGSQEKFSTEIKAFGNNFQPHNTMKYLDDLILKGNEKIEVILDFMLKPKERLLEIFEKEWEEKKNKILGSIQKAWINDVENKLNLIKHFFKDIYDKMSNKGLLIQSINLFTVINIDKSMKSMAQSEYEEDFRKLIGKYVCDSIKGEWKNQEIYEIPNSIKLKPKAAFPHINGIQDEKVKTCLVSNLQEKSIANISVFLTEMVSKIDNEISNFKSKVPNSDILDTENLKKVYQDSFIGCYAHCSLCGRKCDEKHSLLKTKHKCITGHQFKVFGGSKYENNDPTFVACNLMKDKDEIIFEGNTIKWSEFKAKQVGWDYESNSIETVEILEKNKKIWSLIGKKVCEHYTKLGNTINYTEWKDHTFFVPRIHLILLLDDSGSMTCQGSKPGVTRWQELMDAVRSTFQLIIKNSTLKSSIKASVYIHIQKIVL